MATRTDKVLMRPVVVTSRVALAPVVLLSGMASAVVDVNVFGSFGVTGAAPQSEPPGEKQLSRTPLIPKVESPTRVRMAPRMSFHETLKSLSSA